VTPFNSGDTFFTPPDHSQGGEHLWFVVAAETVGAQRVIIANISSRAPMGELTQCMLGRADHRKIRHDSYLRTDWVRCVDQQSLAKITGIERKDPIGADTLRRIREALRSSPNTSKEVKRALDEMLSPIPPSAPRGAASGP
jgi:hypothetical protein